MKQPAYATVRILDVPYHVDKPYTYALPAEYREDAQPGVFVLVPFGNGNRHVMGLITALHPDAKAAGLGKKIKELKPILKIVSTEFALNAELLDLCEFLADHTFSTVGDAAKTVIPAGALRRMYEKYEISDNPMGVQTYAMRYANYDCPEVTLYEALRKAGGMRRERIEKRFSDGMVAVADSMVRSHILEKKTYLSDADNRAVTMYAKSVLREEDLRGLLTDNPEVIERLKYKRRGAVYKEILKQFVNVEGAELSREELLAGGDGITWKAVKELERSHILATREEEAYRNPYADAAKNANPADDNVLSAEQEAARASLSALFQTGEAKAALLHGVTGSGKTRVVKAMMDEVIAAGRKVIMLVPEISLTPQSVAIFCAYYGERVALIHSGLSVGERLDVWRRIKADRVDIVIGTRSAIFVPFENIGMIVIDEEQEHTYKSDLSPKYHARDVARFRCHRQNALMLLASATPSFESYYKAQRGIYSLVTLKNRYGGATLPRVMIEDMHDKLVHTTDVCEAPLGAMLSAQIQKVKEGGEQAILFINRRGYHRYISCLSCKSPIMCPHCSVPMTLHKKRDDARASRRPDDMYEGELICHYCGWTAAVPMVCPSCRSAHLFPFGYGTERAEQDIETKFPDVRLLRMDTDTTKGKFAHEEILDAFRAKKADILLGTQMVAKGHDFPDVTLVGVLAADALIYNDDYRAAEQAFSLITQVVGRAGRASIPGCAVIQTYDPQNEVLQLASRQDYETFYHKYIRMRDAMVFPPFCDMVVFSFSADEEAEVMRAAGCCYEALQNAIAPEGAYSGTNIVLFGPFEAKIYRMNGKFRMRIIIKCRANKRERALIASVLYASSEMCGTRVSVSVDVNPTNL